VGVDGAPVSVKTVLITPIMALKSCKKALKIGKKGQKTGQKDGFFGVFRQ